MLNTYLYNERQGVPCYTPLPFVPIIFHYLHSYISMNITSLYRKICVALVLSFCALTPLQAQQGESMYGDVVKADVKMQYVYSLEEALEKAKAENKLVFFNCFADWAVPCHGMNKHVFSDADFAGYMNKNFVNLFIDVSKREASSIAQQFNIRTFAHYLILNPKGEVVMRIVGGKKLPDFKNDVIRALSPKTSLQGTTAAYNAGKRGKKEVLNYLYALQLAAEDETFKKVGAEYLQTLAPSELSKAENWFLYSRLLADYKSERYELLLKNKSAFVKNNGEKAVNGAIEGLFYGEMADFATGNSKATSEQLMDLYLRMKQAELPDTALVFTLHRMAKFRTEKDYIGLLQFMRERGDRLGQNRTGYELTFDFPEMSEPQRIATIAYLKEAQQRVAPETAKHYQSLIHRLEQTDGILFANISFAEALTKAKAENKLIFMDCYTTWCGPCKKMANEVFTLPEVGRVFNAKFINLKVDMEKGEGVELAKRFKVSAYPTLLLIDSEGNVVKQIVGARSGQALLNEMTLPQ